MLDVRIGPSDLVETLLAQVAARVAPTGWASVVESTKVALRWLSLHTGVPALLLAAVLVCVGYRVMKRTLKFAVEVAAVALLLFGAWHLGFIQW